MENVMRAIMLKAPMDISIMDVPPPEQKTGEVMIQVHGMGICGSDIAAYKGVNPLVSYPRIIGHEIAGEVLEAPPGRPGLRARRPGGRGALCLLRGLLSVR